MIFAGAQDQNFVIADCKLYRIGGRENRLKIQKTGALVCKNSDSDKIAPACSMACCLLNLMKFVRSSDRGPKTAEIYKNFKNTGAKCPNLIMHV